MLNRQPQVSVLPHQIASQDLGGEEEPQQLHDQKAPLERQVQETRRRKRGWFILRLPLQDHPRTGDTECVQKQNWIFL